MGVWGKQRRFSCANVSQSAPSNHRPVFSRDQGLRHSLNNLAALCHRALGSQPSKVMTERRWLTSPPIHSHYHLFTGPDSRQTKHEDHAGEEKSSMLYKLCHKAEHNQTLTFSQHPQVSGKSPLCATLWNKHTSHTWSSKPAVTNKRDDGHTHTEKRSRSDTQQGQASGRKPNRCMKGVD